MQISFTEKKNIRKIFGKIKESFDIHIINELKKNKYE